jgi:hypothetical protein
MVNAGRGDPTLTNVTFSGNNGESTGGAMYNEDSRPLLTNCILWGNSAPIGAQIHNAGNSPPSVMYSDVEGGYSGEGNIDADPLFVDPVRADQAPTLAGGYRLTGSSPAVDVATNDAVTVDTDLDGNPRIVDGTGDGSAVVDMGAYEFQNSLSWLTLIKQGEGTVTSTPEGIDCGSVCTAGFPAGTEVTLTATAETGWAFGGWSGDVESADNPLTLTIEGDTDLTATFTQEGHTLGLTVVGQGDVDVDPDQASYDHGDAVTLTATADTGWTFGGWSGDIASTENPLPLTMGSNKTLTATFGLKTYVITPTASAGGVITPSRPQTVNHGDDITFTIAATGGKRIVDVLVDGISQGAISSYTFIDVTAEHTISATFAPRSGPGFSSGDHTTFVVGRAEVFTVKATGVPTPTIALSGGLPDGVTFTNSGNGTATLSGTPPVGSAGVYPLTFTASNGVAPDVNQAFTLTVNARVYLPLVLTDW